MFDYECFYKGKRITVNALRSYDAQVKAAELLKVKENKRYQITVVLAAKKGAPVVHGAAEV